MKVQTKSIASHGEHGGPLCCIVAKYEDSTEKQYGYEVIESLTRQRDVLADELRDMSNGCHTLMHCSEVSCNECFSGRACRAPAVAGMEEKE